jgi:hypothetical protein
MGSFFFLCTGQLVEFFAFRVDSLSRNYCFARFQNILSQIPVKWNLQDSKGANTAAFA